MSLEIFIRLPKYKTFLKFRFKSFCKVGIIWRLNYIVYRHVYRWEINRLNLILWLHVKSINLKLKPQVLGTVRQRKIHGMYIIVTLRNSPQSNLTSLYS